MWKIEYLANIDINNQWEIRRIKAGLTVTSNSHTGRIKMCFFDDIRTNVNTVIKGIEELSTPPSSNAFS